MWPWKNPLQLLGKTSLRALLYFWKLPFYSEKYSAKIQQTNLQLISFPVPHSNLEIIANRTAINVVRPPFCVQKNQQAAPRFFCKPLLENRAKICLSLCAESTVQICSTAALECVPSYCLLLLPAQKSLFLSCSSSHLLPICSWKNWIECDLFLLFIP